jgi:hypothetical protein
MHLLSGLSDVRLNGDRINAILLYVYTSTINSKVIQELDLTDD